jgi:large subunit ribosomal protein L17
MRHRKYNHKLSRTSSHQRAMISNMLKSLILNERIETTVAKAKVLKRYADKMITLAKKQTLTSRREAIAELMITFNPLTSKQKRQSKNGKEEGFNQDRLVIKKLFDGLGPRFSTREGGYTRLVKGYRRIGDGAETCLIEYLAE